MSGVEFVVDRATRAGPALSDRMAPKVSRAAIKRGLVCRPMPGSDVLDFLPPRITEEGDVDRICEILDAAITAASAQMDPSRSSDLIPYPGSEREPRVGVWRPV